MRYKVTVPFAPIKGEYTYEIDAASEEEAIKLVQDGDLEPSDTWLDIEFYCFDEAEAEEIHR